MAANPYEGVYDNGAVVFNTLPFLQLSMQMQARKEARRQALDSYYQDLSKNLTSSGMASNDVPDFMGKVNTWRDYILQNRKTLDNPNSKEYAQVASKAGYLYNDAIQHASTSKQKVKDLSQFNQLRLSHPDYTITDAGMQSASDAGLPIAKGYKPIDWGAVEYNPKEKGTNISDLTKYENFVKNGLQMSEGQPQIQILPDKKTKVITTKSSFDPATINTIARRSELLYQTDADFKHIVDSLLQKPENYHTYNDAFKRVYGHDIDIKHPEEFATAVLLGQTEKTNTQPYAYSPTIINMPKEEKDMQNVGMSIDNYIDQLKANSSKETYTHKGNEETHYKIQPNTDLADALSIGTGASKRLPEQIDFMPNGDVMPIFYKTNAVVDKKTNQTNYEYTKDSKGRNVVDTDLSKPIGINEFRIRVAKTLLGQTGAKAEMQLQSKKGQSGQTEQTYKINGKDYTQSQIEKGAKHYGLTVDEYLKRLGYK